jgi:hypothetical protein
MNVPLYPFLSVERANHWLERGWGGGRAGVGQGARKGDLGRFQDLCDIRILRLPGECMVIVISCYLPVFFLVSRSRAPEVPGGSGMNSTYEVILGPAAIQVFRALRTAAERRKLAAALRQELLNGPNARTEIRFDPDGKPRAEADPDVPGEVVYTASPLSFRAYTAVHRPMTEAELVRLSREQRREVASLGFHVLDILRPELGFTRWQ